MINRYDLNTRTQLQKHILEVTDTVPYLDEIEKSRCPEYGQNKNQRAKQPRQASLLWPSLRLSDSCE